MKILLPQMIGHFFFELPELKAFSIKHFPQDICQTTKQVDACHISKQKDFFCWPRTHGSNLRENCFFGTRKKTTKYKKMIADHGSPSWKLKCVVAEVGWQG